MTARILVVDDEPQLERLILQRFRKKIRDEHYEFVFASDGVDALEKLDENDDIDMVLCDINMPRMDGLTLVSRLAELGTMIKTVMVSAYSDMSNIRAAMNLGAYDFVTKPIDFKDLETTIEKTLKEIDILKRAALAQKRLGHLEQELKIANDIQQSILPRDFSIFPASSSLEIYAEMIPAKEIGGDFYDFFWLDDERLALVIGDVSGKGMPAALFMAISRTLLKAMALRGGSTNECLAQVNKLLSQDNPKSMFVTVFYGVLDTRSDILEYSNGGHNAPLLLSAKGELRSLEEDMGSALGVIEDLSYMSSKVSLTPDSRLILYTDGITEAINNDFEEFSAERLRQAFSQRASGSAAEILRGIIQDVQDFADGAPQSDDLTGLVLKRGAETGDSESPVSNRLSIRIKNELSEIHRVHSLLERFSEAHQLPPGVTYAVDLALDEVITNIVSHGYTEPGIRFIDFTLTLAEGEVVLEITDDGVPFDPLTIAEPDTASTIEDRAIGGLGIHLVRNLMTEIGYRYESGTNRLVLTKELKDA